MIELIFTNSSGTSVNIKHVQTVEWNSIANDETYVGRVARTGAREREIVINGYISNGITNRNIAAQQELETNLRNVGSGTLSYTGATTIQNVRFLSLDFAEYRGNPIAEFTIKFRTEENNIHSHTPASIGSLVLSAVNGFEPPSVRDQIEVQGPDEQLVNNKKRSFVIEGRLVGDTLDDINTRQANLIAEVQNKTTLVITLTVASSGAYVGSYTVRPRRLEFSSPELNGKLAARRYIFECETHDDYSKEPYTFGEVATTFSSITLDVVTGVDHNRETERLDAGPTYSTISEELVVNGKKYFDGYTAYQNFRDLFRPIPTNIYLVASTSGNILELVDIAVGSFERSGNNTTGDKRYAATVTLTFKWHKSVNKTNYEVGTTHFGVSWYTIPSLTFNVTLDGYGNISNRSVNVSGSVLSSNLALLQSKIGTSVNYDATYSNLYVTSVNVTETDTYNVSGGEIAVYKVSVSAQQLDTAAQATFFLTGLFKFSRAGGSGTSYSTDQILFDHVTNRSKSISNRYNQQQLKFTVTSISLSVSGEVWDTDSSGSPTTPNKIVDIFNKIDALLSAPVSTQGSANTYGAGELLPSNSDIFFLLTNVNIGQWEPFTKQIGTNRGQRYWKQTVSVSATAVFDLNQSGGSQPDSVESKSISIDKQQAKYATIQVLGQGTVFKRIGTTPEIATVTYQKQFKDARTYTPNDYGADDVNPTGWRGVGRNVESKDSRENRGLVNRHIREYTATADLET